MARITIESILGGASPSSHFAARDQFLGSLGIDPARPIIAPTGSTSVPLSTLSSGLLRPVAVTNIFNSTSSAGPYPVMWFRQSPKDGEIYAYGASGSVYVVNPLGGSATGLSDKGEMANSSGNGMEYYDNYLYLAKDTDIARYGPLNGTPTFNGTYWTGTLGKAALVNTNYAQNNGIPVIRYPNHPMHRHSDGKLYILDVVNNQGAVHVISTTKTTVEGDTDNGSTASKLLFGFGLYPQAIESYGSDLVIALNELSGGGGLGDSEASAPRAKIAFWDTTSTNFNQITWVEYPDTYISAMRNINGTLYVFSGSPNWRGIRVTQFVGGYTFKEVAYIPNGSPPFPGAVDGDSQRLLFGTITFFPEVAAAVYSLGLENAALSSGLFAPFRATVNPSTYSNFVNIFAILTNRDTNITSYDPLMSWGGYQLVGTRSMGIDVPSDDTRSYGDSVPVWWSQLYKVGQPFEIQRIRIPFAQQLGANQTITVKLYTDGGSKSQVLTQIDSTNFPSTGPGGGYVANIKTAGDGQKIIRGENDFFIELRWTGTALATVSMPIIIDFEVTPD